MRLHPSNCFPKQPKDGAGRLPVQVRSAQIPLFVPVDTFSHPAKCNFDISARNVGARRTCDCRDAEGPKFLSSSTSETSSSISFGLRSIFILTCF